MKQWKLKMEDFRSLLEDKQDYKCALTGLPLLPENVHIALKMPLKRGGKAALSNVYLVHESIAKLTKDLTQEEIRSLAKAIIAQEASENTV